MAGTWMAVVEGFGGVRVRDGGLHMRPSLPKRWKSYSFRILFRGAVLCVKVAKDSVEVRNESTQPAVFSMFDKACALDGNSSLRHPVS